MVLDRHKGDGLLNIGGRVAAEENLGIDRGEETLSIRGRP